MKIIFNNTIFYKQKYGGVSRYISLLAKELIKNNIDVKIIAPLYKNKYLKEISKINKKGIYIKRFPDYKVFNFISNLLTIYYINKSESNIIHDTYYSSSLLKIRNKTNILTIYDLIHEKFPHFYERNYISHRKKIIENSDFFICISEKTRQDFIGYYKVPIEKTKVIHLGAEHILDYSKNIKSINFKKKPFLLYVGSRSKYKNFKLLAKAVAKSDLIMNNFDIVCFGGGNFTKEEKNFFENNSITNFISIASGDDNILATLYSEATALVFTSVYEGFGLPMIEAMASKCPLFVSDIDITKEVCLSSAEYFDSQDSDDLKFKLENTLFDSLKLKELAHKGYNLSKKYNWKKCADKTIDVYKKFI